MVYPEAQLRADAQEAAHGDGRAQPPAGFAPHLRRKNFCTVVLPAKPLDEQTRGCGCPGARWSRTSLRSWTTRTLLEFSFIDITEVKADEAALADMISVQADQPR